MSLQLLQAILEDEHAKSNAATVPWSAVYHLVGDICYGGKITDAQDMKILKALLRKYCSQQTLNKGYDEHVIIVASCSETSMGPLASKLAHRQYLRTASL